MSKNKHVYLKNHSTKSVGFKKTRNLQIDEPEFEYPKFPNQAQQERLRKARALYYRDRKIRIENKSISGLPSIDLVKIYFFKTFNKELSTQFYERYGLLPSSYEGFNKTVLFEVQDKRLFAVFTKHLELYFNSSTKETYQGKEYNLISLIFNFSFLTSRRRIKSFSGNITSFGLIPTQNSEAFIIYKALLNYLNDKKKEIFQSELTAEFLEVSELSIADLNDIVDNFDIIKTISSTRVERRRPGLYGDERRAFGFSVDLKPNAPTIGIIDTGVSKIDPLIPCLFNYNYDITGYGSYWDEMGHGTAVAALVTLGEDFYKTIKNSYEACAKIAVIKVLQKGSDNINIAKLIEIVIEAKEKYNIRIFNLSLNEPGHKNYNEGFSDYAYLLDRIAFQYDILFFISVGNVGEQRLRELIDDEPHSSHEYPQIFYSLDGGSEIHICETTNISVPSESMNNISVGALAGNLEDRLSSDITPAEEFPAYYTRKFHYDYEQPVNGSHFMKSQKNKHLNKPDLVMEGGDLFLYESGMEILTSPMLTERQRFFSRNSGTSLATPLVTSLAGVILSHYPELRTQTVKAMIINTATLPCPANSKAFQGFQINLLRKLVGFGRPNKRNIVTNGNDSITFLIEDEISLEELRTIELTLPNYINRSGNKLNFTGTLSYSFLPIKDNQLCYLPLQITFGIFKLVDAPTMSKMNAEDYKIKPGISWSDDFFGIENRLLSNVQKINSNVSGLSIEQLGNKICIAIKCTGKKEIPDSDKDHLANIKHKFSLVLTVTELPTTRASNKLYNEMLAINNIETIIEVEGEATLEV